VIDLVSPVLLREQVAGAIRRAVADGEIISGERMPPARDPAAVLGVNASAGSGRGPRRATTVSAAAGSAPTAAALSPGSPGSAARWRPRPGCCARAAMGAGRMKWPA